MDGILSWLTRNLSRFDPPQEDAIFETVPELITPGRSRKAFGELGLALRLAHRVPELRARREVRELSEGWLAYARRRKIFFDARRRVHLVPLMAVALAVLQTLDRVPGDARQALQAVLDRGFFDRTERSAWSQIDIAYYLDSVGLCHRFPSVAELLPQSSLVALPAVAHAQRIDLYAATHLVFHGTDFGMDAEALASLGTRLHEVRHYAALALATALTEHDWDLVGEFLATRICLRERPDALSRHAAEALLRAQQPAGFIPDLRWLRGISAASEDERAVEEFFAVYHPTLVALIALACDMSVDSAMEVAA